MEIAQIAQTLGIAAYPAEFEELWKDAADRAFLTQETVDELQNDHNFFGPYYDAVCAALKDLESREALQAWGKTALAYNLCHTAMEAASVPFPAPDGTPAGDLLPMLVLAAMIPEALEQYTRRGFAPEEIRKNLMTFQNCMTTVTRKLGRPAMDKKYYGWLCVFAKAVIYTCDGVQFELRKFSPDTLILRNRETGQIQPLPLRGQYHRSGYVLGSGGYKNPEGAFTPTVRETEDCYYGCPVINCLATAEEKAFPKAQWECAIKPGDTVFTIHFPRNADIRPEVMSAAFEKGYATAKIRYPEEDVKGIYTATWLLDPMLDTILKETSNIRALAARFARYPRKSSGTEVFGYVFSKMPEDYNDLPEETSLQRNLKKIYLEGKRIHGFAGVILK